MFSLIFESKDEFYIKWWLGGQIERPLHSIFGLERFEKITSVSPLERSESLFVRILHTSQASISRPTKEERKNDQNLSVPH